MTPKEPQLTADLRRHEVDTSHAKPDEAVRCRQFCDPVIGGQDGRQEHEPGPHSSPVEPQHYRHTSERVHHRHAHRGYSGNHHTADTRRCYSQQD